MPSAHSRKSKTSRFPVARIKKIMQTDEEVGKLASATPVMISKSLECFLQLLVEEACKETRSRGSKKMTAYHLKQTIMTRPTLDFLIPVTANISDPAPSEDKPAKSSGPSRRNTSGPVSAIDGPSRKRSTGVKQENDHGHDHESQPAHGYGQDGRYSYGGSHAQQHHIPPEHYQEIQAGQPYHLPYLHQQQQQQHQPQYQQQQYQGGYDRSAHLSASPYSAQPPAQGYHLPHLHSSSSGNDAHGSGSSYSHTQDQNHTHGQSHNHAHVGHGSVNPQILPNIDTWKKEASGGGGMGEGGRGMFDDYEDDDEDY